MKWRAHPLRSKIHQANEAAVAQVSDLLQHLHDVDHGDLPTPAFLPRLEQPLGPDGEALPMTADDAPSIGPSSHTNPLPTADLVYRALQADEAADAMQALRTLVGARAGFSLWLGPSQAATPDNKAGLYLRGAVPPGTVVGMYPGAVYSKEMLQRPADYGHLGDPRRPRMLIPRLDGTVVDALGHTPPVFNPFGLAHHCRHPAPGVQPNVMRLQVDFFDRELLQSEAVALPRHLRPYLPNEWGSKLSGGQVAAADYEHAVWMKGIVLVSLREVRDEELFVDHRLNPGRELPAWYVPVDAGADRRLWLATGAPRRVMPRAAMEEGGMREALRELEAAPLVDPETGEEMHTEGESQGLLADSQEIKTDAGEGEKDAGDRSTAL